MGNKAKLWTQEDRFHVVQRDGMLAATSIMEGPNNSNFMFSNGETLCYSPFLAKQPWIIVCAELSLGLENMSLQLI